MPAIEAQPPHKYGGPYLALRFCDENMWVQQMTES